MKKFTALMLCALIVPSFSSAMNNNEDGNLLGNIFQDNENPDQEDNAQENVVENDEDIEVNEPAPVPNPDRLAQMRAMQERAQRIAQRLAQNNPEEQEFEHECPICRDAEATIQLPCDHRICRACLTNWATHQEIPNAFEAAIFRNAMHLRDDMDFRDEARQENTCPTCRAAIPGAFIRQTLTDNISSLQKAQLRLSLLGKGFLSGLFLGSVLKDIFRWWRSPYLEKTAQLGNSIYSYGATVLIYGFTQGYRIAQDLRPLMHENALRIDNDDALEVLYKHGKRLYISNKLMKIYLAIKTKHKPLIRNTLHTQLLFPSIAIAAKGIPYMNKNYAYKLCARTASKKWSFAGTCLGLYYTNKIYNAYNKWGSRMLTRAGISI